MTLPLTELVQPFPPSRDWERSASVAAGLRSVPLSAPARPFIRWVGGKGRLLQNLLPHVPDKVNDYYEPFLGGGAMFFAVQPRTQGTSHLFDLNEELTNAWVALRSHSEELLQLLRYYTERDSEEFYYSVRPMEPIGLVPRAARFFYLNQTSWNGLWRVNKFGKFNVPWGRKPFRGLSPAVVDDAMRVLARTNIACRDFRSILSMPEVGDFVYLDPPYLPISDTSKFHLYTERRFRAADLATLALACDELSDRGVNWMMSNRDTSLVRELFQRHQMTELTARRAVAAQNRRDVEKVQSPELIIVGVSS